MINKTGKLRIICLCICLFTTIICCTHVYAGNDNYSDQIIRVGWYDMAGYQEYDDKGNECGFYYDYLQTISYFTGWKYEYINAKWSDCVTMLSDGDIDLICGMNMTDERLQHFDYSKSPIDTEMYSIYYPDNGSIPDYEDYDNFNGLRIAVARDSFEALALSEYAVSNGFEYTEILTDSFSDAEEAINDGRADALVSSSMENHSGYTVIGQYAPDLVYFATTKGNSEIISGIDYAMTQIFSYYPDFNTVLNKNNFQNEDRQSLSFSKSELEFIKKSNTIYMACGNNWYPYEYYDAETGGYAGISVEIMREIARISGLDIEFIEDTGYSMSDFANKYGNNYITSMSYDSRWADDSNVYQTQPFLSCGVFMLYKDVTAPKTVALLDGGYIYRNAVKYYPDLEVITCETALDCIEAVESGKADCTFLNEYESNYYISMAKYQDINQKKISEFDQNICFGISDESSPELEVILSKTLNSISRSKIAEIVNDNAIPPKDTWIRKMLYENPQMFIGIIVAFLCAIASIAFLVMRITMEKSKRKEIELANESKTAFLSRISHDMRTPMNGIIGLVSLSENENNIEVLRDNIFKIGSSGEYLLSLINDTLDMNKLEANKMTLNSERVYAKALVENIIDMISRLAKEKNIEFVTELNAINFDTCIYVDEVRLKQIFINLLSNAVKFTQNGGKIVVEAMQTGHSILMMEGHEYIGIDCIFKVNDNGIGMSQDFVKNRLFHPFSQENNKLTSQYAGSGLGLAIVKNIVELMGGTIDVKSSLGKGTTFTVFLTIPTAEADTSSQIINRSTDYTRLENKRILLVDDHPMNREIALRMMKKHKMQVETAENGREAVEKYETSIPGYYDAILMDIRMPVMDGLEAAKCIRDNDREDAKTIPVIAMTANAYNEDIMQTVEAGMNAHLAKPVKPDDLFQMLLRFM